MCVFGWPKKQNDLSLKKIKRDNTFLMNLPAGEPRGIPTIYIVRNSSSLRRCRRILKMSALLVQFLAGVNGQGLLALMAL